MNIKTTVFCLLLFFKAISLVAQPKITHAYYLSKVLVQLNNNKYFTDDILGENRATYDSIYKFISVDSFRWNTNIGKPYLTFRNITEVSQRIKSGGLEFISNYELLKDKHKKIDSLRSKLVNDSLKKRDSVETKARQIKQLITTSNDSANSLQSYSALDDSQFDILKKDNYLIKGIVGLETFLLSNDSLQKFDSLLNEYLTLRDSLNTVRSQIESYTSSLNIISNKIEAGKKLSKGDLLAFESLEEYAQSNVYSKDGLIYVSIENKSTEHLGTASSSFKFPDETEVIDALAIFVANRFKEELTLTFVDELKYQIRTNENIKLLFPHTLEALESLEGYKLPTIGDNLFLALAQDVLNLDTTVAQISFLSKDAANTLKAVNTFSRSLDKGYLFESIVEQLDDQKVAYISNDSLFGNLLHAVRVINDNFRSYDGKSFYMRFSDLKKMSDVQFDYFIALLVNSEPLVKKFIFKEYGNSRLNRNDLANIRTRLGNLLLALEGFENSINKSQGKERNVAIGQSLVSLFKEVDLFFSFNGNNQKGLTIIEHSLEILRHKMKGDYKPILGHIVEIIKIGIRSEQEVQVFDSIMIQITVLNNAVKGIRDIYINNRDANKEEWVKVNELIREYIRSNALSNIIDSSYFDLDKNRSTELEKIARIVSFPGKVAVTNLLETSKELYLYLKTVKSLELLNETYKDKFKDTLEDRINRVLELIYKKKNTITQTIERLSKVGGFATDILKAGNSKELANVFEAYAAPVNSYKIKRTTRNSWAINAFVGLYGGVEDNWTVKDKLYGTFGVTVPIGITYSWGNRKKLSRINEFDIKRPYNVFMGCSKLKILNGWATSVTATIIDISAPFIYRFKNGADGGLPKEIKFEQIFSPGMLVSFHFPRQPLCINIGAQLTPQLTDFNNPLKTYDAIRFSAGIAFDIPLFQISQRTSFDK